MPEVYLMRQKKLRGGVVKVLGMQLEGIGTSIDFQMVRCKWLVLCLWLGTVCSISSLSRDAKM